MLLVVTAALAETNELPQSVSVCFQCLENQTEKESCFACFLTRDSLGNEICNGSSSSRGSCSSGGQTGELPSCAVFVYASTEALY